MIFYYNDTPTIQKPVAQLEIEYRNFKVRKTPEYELYSIVPPQGKIMTKELEGDFSQLRLLEAQIDSFLANHQNIADAFIDAEPAKPKRGRPPKKNLPTEQTAEETSLL
jgi:hypothetical protein